MNFLVGKILFSYLFVGLLLLVSGCDESLVFSVFLSMILSPEFMLYFMYSPGLPLLKLLTYIIKEETTKLLPAIIKNFELNEIPDSFWVTKMLLSLYIYCFN